MDLHLSGNNFANALSKELAPKNIRVNSVSPGPVSTGLWMEEGRAADGFAEASNQTADDVGAMIENVTPTGRFTTPEQVADLVVFLASDRAGKHHRIRLPHRRRVRHHPLIRLNP